MNLTASTVCFVLIVTRCFSFCTNAPKHIMKDISAMFESSSADWPMPSGCPCAFSFGAALRTFSHVLGAIPVAFQ